jgi:hypothetical protein
MIEPAHPTEAEILGRINYHEAGAELYAQHVETAALEAWSRERVEYWRKKLPPEATVSKLNEAPSQPTVAIITTEKDVREPGDGE